MRLILALFMFLVVAIASVPSEAAAQRGGRAGQGPRYDTSTEATLRGTVQDVKQVTGGPGMRGLSGTHVVIRTDQETIEVHFGPSAFLVEQKFAVQTGDSIVVVGSRTTVAGAAVVLAREVRKGDQTVTLRDAQGFPKWARGARR